MQCCPFALSLLRLPKLELVRVRVDGDLPPISMGRVLYSLRTQLAGSVHSLYFELRQSWAGAAQAWKELSKHDGLTKLELMFGREVGY
jgi:hypothetical protein